MLSELHTNPTQFTGLLAFSLAALACARAAALRHGRGAAVWRRLATVHAAFFLEILFGGRHRAHDVVDGLLESHGWYAERSELQMPLILVAVLLASGAIATLLRWPGIDARARAAMACSVVTLGAFVVEAISLHGVDALMYGMVGPVKRIGCLWAASAAVVAIMATLSAADRPGSGPASPR